jgi:hypothetical protein
MVAPGFHDSDWHAMDVSWEAQQQMTFPVREKKHSCNLRFKALLRQRANSWNTLFRSSEAVP